MNLFRRIIMILPTHLRIVSKHISVLTAGIFLWSQAAWAVDLIDLALDKQYNDQSQTFAPSYLQNQQTLQENLISSKNDIENFNASALSEPASTSEVVGTGDLSLQGPKGGGGASQKAIASQDEPLIQGEEPEPVSYEYDSYGRLIKTIYSNGDFNLTEYYGTTTNKRYDMYFGADLDWKYSKEYYEGTAVAHYKWAKDIDPAAAGNETYCEYDTLGRKTLRKLDTGDWVGTSYHGSTNNKYQEWTYGSDLVWKYSVEYYESSSFVHYKWTRDLNPAAPGDETYCEYDTLGRKTLKILDTGGWIGTSYYGVTANKYQEWAFGSGGNWQWSSEYYEDGMLFHRKWIADANPGSTGDITYKEYDTEGMLFRKATDTGTSIDYTSMNYYSSWEYPSTTLRVGKDPSGEIATFRYINGRWLVNSVVWEGSLTSWDYDAGGILTGHRKTLSDGVIRIYDATGRLTEQRIPDSFFMKGVNMPWINYGYDIGTYLSANLETLYGMFDKWKGSYVRIFLFCDLRSGINFDINGNPVSFSSGVFVDMRLLINAAKTFNIKLVPVLFDYMMADNMSGTYLGEHPDLITDPAKKQKLLDLFGGFFDEFAGDSSIYAWDVMNEPEYASAISMYDARSFVSSFVGLIHSKSLTAKVTVGSGRRDWLVNYWQGLGLDIYQYHYYDGFESDLPLGYPASGLGLDKPVMVGELEPTQVLSKIGTVKTNGYLGGFFWQDTNFIIDEGERTSILDFFSGTRIIYT
jgi:hypothetical protein